MIIQETKTITYAGTDPEKLKGADLSWVEFVPASGEYGYINIVEANTLHSSIAGLTDHRIGQLNSYRRVDYIVRPGGIVELTESGLSESYAVTDTGTVTDMLAARTELYVSGNTIKARVYDNSSYHNAGTTTAPTTRDLAIPESITIEAGVASTPMTVTAFDMAPYSGGGLVYIHVGIGPLASERIVVVPVTVSAAHAITVGAEVVVQAGSGYGSYSVAKVGDTIVVNWTPANPPGSITYGIESAPYASYMNDAVTISELNGISATLTVNRNTDYPYDLFPSTNYINASTGKSLRFAAKESQGQGFSVYNGDSWIWPELFMETLRIFNGDNEPVNIAWDETTGLPYQLDVRTAPTGSAIVDSFLDKKSSNQAGTEIATKIRFTEHTAQRESMLIEHLDTHIKIRPTDELNKGATGYTTNGFRTAFEMDINGYEDGESVATRESVDIPDNGIISFQGLLEANRIQIECETTTSDFRIIGQTTDYLEKDTGGSDDKATTNEMTAQQDYYNKALWFSKYSNLKLNLATAVEGTGTYFGLVTGPDGDSYGISMAGEAGVSSESVSLSGNFSIQMFMASIAATTVLYMVGAINVLTLVVAGAVRTLRYNDGVNGNVDQILTWDGTGWCMITVSRDGLNITFIEGK